MAQTRLRHSFLPMMVGILSFPEDQKTPDGIPALVVIDAKSSGLFIKLAVTVYSKGVLAENDAR